MKYHVIAGAVLALSLGTAAWAAEGDATSAAGATTATPSATPSTPTTSAPSNMSNTSDMSTQTQACDVATVQQSADQATGSKKRKALAEIKLAQSAQAKNDTATCQAHIQKAQSVLNGA